MKKPLALRIEPELLIAARECARQDNRTLTNFIETALRERIDHIMLARPAAGAETNTRCAKDAACEA